MCQFNNHSQIQKAVLASLAAAVACLFFTAIPASACTVSPLAKSRSALPAAASASAMAFAQSATSDPASKSPSFVGLWDAKLIVDGQVIDEGFDAFHSDGTEILVDQSNPITDNVCLGIWEQTGPLTIKLKHPSWYFDTNGNLLGVVIIHETLKLDPNGDTYSGTSVEDVYDTQGNKLGTSTAQITAKRIKVS